MNNDQQNEKGRNAMQGKMNLRIFKSFEEAAEAEALDSARKDPMEGLRETVELILRTYGVTRADLSARRKEKMHITITRRS